MPGGKTATPPASPGSVTLQGMSEQAAAGVRVNVYGQGEATVETGLPVLNRLLTRLAENAGLVLHVRLLNGTDSSHVLEAIFKGLGAALAEACARQGTPR